MRHLKMQTLAFQLTFHSGKLYIWVDVWPRLTLHLPTDCRQGHYDWPQICSWWWCDLHKPSLTYQPNKTFTLIRGVSSPLMLPWQGAAQCLIIYFHYCLLLYKIFSKYWLYDKIYSSSFQKKIVKIWDNWDLSWTYLSLESQKYAYQRTADRAVGLASNVQ